MNVSRVYRLLKLITLLRSGRRMDATELSNQLGVSRRTFFRDLNLLESAGIPYRFEQDGGTYAISDSFFLPSLHLDLQEAMALLLITRKFLARQATPHYQKALDAALKIESSLPKAVLEYCGEMLDGVSVRWPPLSPADASSSTFNRFQQAIAHHQCVAARYDSVYDQREINVCLEPLRLVFSGRGWYLIANSRTHGEVRTFKVDRFLESDLTGETFKVNGRFDERFYFGSAWRMIPDGRIYDVRLRFDATVAASVEEVQWHESQRCRREPDGRLIFQVRIDGLREIGPWILGYGPQVEVLDPPELREWIRRRAEETAERARRLDDPSGAPRCD